jgi:hypothetical protein
VFVNNLKTLSITVVLLVDEIVENTERSNRPYAVVGNFNVALVLYFVV